MINNRVAFMSALAFAVLSLFLVGSSEASLNNGDYEPSDETRLDPSAGISFSVVLNANNDNDEGITSIVAIFGDPDGSWTGEVDLECDTDVADCEGTGDDLDGTWKTPVTLTAGDTVSSPGEEVIFYNFKATMDSGNEYVWNGGVDTVSTDPAIHVNTLPSLSDDAAVTGDDMPYSVRTVTITYTDADGHAGVLSATVCEDSDPTSCEASFSLSKESGDETTGAVYSADFQTAFGGDLTVTVSGTDGFDSAEDDRTASFSVDTETPWLVNDSVSSTSAGEADQIVFDVVYCVFEAQAGTTVSVNVGGTSIGLSENGAYDACVNGVGTNYTVSTAVAWAAAAQAVQFSASNTAASAENLDSTSVTINDLPVISDGSARKIDSNFIINATVDDINLNDGDSISVFAVIEFGSTVAMGLDENSNYTITVAESAIIDERGGLRTVTFVTADSYGEIVSADFGTTIEVNKTSSFSMSTSSSMSLAPGQNTLTFTIDNDGNFEDTFTISASSLNGWFVTCPAVSVAYDSSSDCDITVNVPHVAAGTKDSWIVSAVATNDASVSNEETGTVTVDTVTGHDLTGDTDLSGNPGDAVTYHFTILNTGNAQEKMDYTVTSSWNVDTPGGSTTLAMGASDTISVTQTIPANAGSGASESVTFTVINGDGSSTSVTTTANQVYGVTVAVGTLTGLNPGESGTLSFTVTNTGNGFDTFTIGHSGVWANAKSDDTISLASGSSATVDITVGIPADAASAASSSIGLSATSSGAASTDSYDVVVASSTRSLAITGGTAYTFNQGTIGQGTATIQNTGVSTTFIVTSMTDSVSFATSEYTVAAGATQDVTFSIMTSSSGDQSFTVSDNVDFSSATHTFSLTARTFSTDMSNWGLGECSNSGATCTYDMDSWDGSAYANAGTWTTTLDYVDANGQTGTHVFDTTIENSNPTVAAPSLGDPVQGTEQLFSFTIPTDADGTVTHFVIDFGDGESQTFQTSDFSGQTVTATHTYSKSGNFDVVATAYDNSGGSTSQTVAVSVSDEMVTLEGSSYTYNLVALIGFFLLGAILSGTAFKLQQGVIAGDEEMNERDRQRLESVERRMESLSEREELMEVSAYDASRAATKLEEHISAFNSILVKAQEIAAEDKLKELEAAEEARQKEEEEMQLDLEDPDIEMVAERFHESLARLVAARDDLSKIEKHLARILKMERDEQLEKLTEMTESYESTKRKIDALESSKEARDAAAVENNIMNMLSAAASGGSMADADFGDFGDLGGDDEYEVEIYEDEDGSFYYIDPDTGEEVPCDEDGNAL